MADEQKVTVALRRSYGYRGQMYGPGEVEVPASLAEALGLAAPRVAAAQAVGETNPGATEPPTEQAGEDVVQVEGAAPIEAPGAVLAEQAAPEPEPAPAPEPVVEPEPVAAKGARKAAAKRG